MYRNKFKRLILCTYANPYGAVGEHKKHNYILQQQTYFQFCYWLKLKISKKYVYGLYRYVGSILTIKYKLNYILVLSGLHIYEIQIHYYIRTYTSMYT